MVWYGVEQGWVRFGRVRQGLSWPPWTTTRPTLTHTHFNALKHFQDSDMLQHFDTHIRYTAVVFMWIGQRYSPLPIFMHIGFSCQVCHNILGNFELVQCLGWFDFKTQFYKLWLNFGFWITLNAKWELNVVFPKAQDTVCTHRPMKCGGFGELSEDWAGKGFPSVFVVYTACMYVFNCISINYILSSSYL